MSEFNQIPGPIVKAVCAVKATLEAVAKSQKNEHGNYRFASTDDIYAAVTQKMGRIGLMCLPLEETAEIQRHLNKDGKEVPWLKVVYAFVLATEEATWLDPRNRRTLLIQITGPQTFQAAQSYCEKSYLRSLFKIPTGDLDLDALPDGYEYSPITLRPRAVSSSTVAPPPPPPPPTLVIEAEPAAQASPEEEFDGASFLGGLDEALLLAGDEEALGETWQHHELDIEDRLSRADRETAADIYRKHEARVRGGRLAEARPS